MSTQPFKALVFDWDGTLMDSAQKIVNCLKVSIELAGLEKRSDAQLAYVIGLGLPEAVNHLYPNLSQSHFNKLCQYYRAQFLYEDRTPSALFEGVAEMLAELDRQGYFLAVATGKGRRGLNKVLEESGVSGLFTVSRCADETASKPDPLMLQEIIDFCGIRPSDALMVGDTEFDLQMAQYAKVERVGVTQGVHSLEQLAKYAPLAILDDVTQLSAWLQASR